MAATHKEFGVFLPIANGGWIVSKTAPPLDGLWPQNRDAAIAAEKAGLDFVMSMGKWRGFGGETDHWNTSMESLVLMSALSQVTKRVKLWATVHSLLHNPVVTAKMITTLDHVSGGRAGLNIVAGAYREEFEQMGAWDDTLNHDDRYVLAEEWLTLIKRLWAEDHVDFDGRFFNLHDCVSEPKPLSRPRPDLICAGMSRKGFEFAVREADACFIGGRNQDERRDSSLRAKAVAAQMGRTVKTYAMCTVVHADTDAKAQALAQRYEDGVDLGAVMGLMRSWGLASGPDLAAKAKAAGAFMTETVIGSPQSCARQIDQYMTYCALDGIMLIFPDYVEGLTLFGEEILPMLRGVPA